MYLHHSDTVGTRARYIRNAAGVVQVEGLIDRLARFGHDLHHRSVHLPVSLHFLLKCTEKGRKRRKTDPARRIRGDVHIQDAAVADRSNIAFENSGGVGVTDPGAASGVASAGHVKKT